MGIIKTQEKVAKSWQESAKKSSKTNIREEKSACVMPCEAQICPTIDVLSNSVRNTRACARKFARVLKGLNHAVILLSGDMGAGKTTFTSQVLHYLDKKIQVQSPTFTLINSYLANIFHADFYRLEHEDELLNTDFLEILEGDNFVFIEWHDRAITYIKRARAPIFSVDIKMVGETKRHIIIKENGQNEL